MPTVISHSLVAIVFGKIFSKRTGVKFWVLSIICAILPDIDVFLFFFNIPNGNMFEHRGISHSLLFALIIALLIVVAGFREIKQLSKEWWSFIAYFFLIGLSYNVLDAMTSGGLGVGFFMPFDSTRYFFPVRPIRASPFRLISFFETEGEQILVSELIWIWIPAVVSLIILWFVKKHKSYKSVKNNNFGEVHSKQKDR
jgi:inner membrane protein